MYLIVAYLFLTGFIVMAYQSVIYAAKVTDICGDEMKRSAQQTFRATNDILYFDQCADCSDSPGSAAPAGGGAGANCGEPLPDTIPEYWRNLINNAAVTHPDTDPRAVAATLWVENRGWPDPNKNWATSSAGAQGPWQFIPSSWASMGEDCNNDGVKDINDPEDSVCAAFNHLKGTACKPLMEGATGDAEADWNSVPYQDKGNETVMSAIQHYNGSGARDGVPLSQQPSNQNGEYIQMAYWLIVSDFTTSYNPSTGEKGDATKSASQGADSPVSPVANPNNGVDASCSSAVATPAGVAKVIQVDGFNYSFPVILPKNDVTNGYAWPCPGICHHDGTPAFDLSKVDPENKPSTGTPTVAITDGTIEAFRTSYNGHDGCQTFQLKGNDGFFYWYGHIQQSTVQTGSPVRAGQQVAVVGERICTDDGHGNLSYEHLHIDRGNKGSYGGSPGNRDSGMVPLVNKLYEGL